MTLCICFQLKMIVMYADCGVMGNVNVLPWSKEQFDILGTVLECFLVARWWDLLLSPSVANHTGYSQLAWLSKDRKQELTTNMVQSLD